MSTNGDDAAGVFDTNGIEQRAVDGADDCSISSDVECQRGD